MLWRFSVNLPWNDDAIFMFYAYRRLLPEITWMQFVTDTFARHVDHLVAVPHLLVLMLSKLTGQLNFKAVVVAGNLSLGASLILLFRSFRKTGLSPWYFVPASLLLCTPVHWEDSLWPLCVLQHNLLVFWVLLSMYCLEKPGRWHFVAAVFTGVLCIFSSGNGFLVLFPGMLMLTSQRRFRELGIWIAALAVSMVPYFINYKPSEATHVSDSLSDPVRFVQYILVFLGGNLSVNFMTRPLILGFFMTVVWLTATVRSFRKNTFSVAWCGLLFLMMTAAIIALSRSWIGIAVVGRYQIYASYALVMTYLLLLDLVKDFRKRIWVIAPVAASAILFAAFAWFSYWPVISFRQQLLTAEIRNWTQNGFFLNVPNDENSAIRRFYPYLLESNFYSFPEIALPPLDAHTHQTDPLPDSLLSYRVENTYLGRVLIADIRGVDQNREPAYLVLSGKETVFVPLRSMPNNKLAFVRTGRPFSPDVSSRVIIEPLTDGDYRMGLAQSGQVRWFGGLLRKRQ